MLYWKSKYRITIWTCFFFLNLIEQKLNSPLSSVIRGSFKFAVRIPSSLSNAAIKWHRVSLWQDQTRHEQVRTKEEKTTRYHSTECTSQNTNKALRVVFALLLGSYNHSLINNKINCCQPTHLQYRHWHAGTLIRQKDWTNKSCNY